MMDKVVKPINRTTFFDKVRKSIFRGKLSQLQVDGMNVILDEWKQRGLYDLRWLGYILATTYHETAHTMQPVAEYGKGAGRKYGVKDHITGKTYFGRGYVQLTWKYNYETFSERLHIDLVNNPDLAMDVRVATDILFEGMIGGLFTGKKLRDFFNDNRTDWVNARQIINGQDLAFMISGYAKHFHEALI